MMATTLVDVHSCIKKNCTVVIKAEVVVRSSGSTFVVLIAHDIYCKAAK